MSRHIRSEKIDLPSFPRVSGDEPADINLLALDGEFSPRERG